METQEVQNQSVVYRAQAATHLILTSVQTANPEIPSPSGPAAQADYGGGGREAAAKTAGTSPVVLT